MRARTILSAMMMLTLTTACGEMGEREEAGENEAAEAAEHQAGEMAEGAEADEAEENGNIELPAELLARAQVTVEAAMSAALARVPGGKIAAGELEEEDGKLIFSFDISVEGVEGIEEVHVDALTGEVIGQEHESAADEAQERDEGAAQR